ncbi:hypothetical protein [Bacteroides sp.]|uniref:hypothetical protein n=1 Tax=Bacteroides sp. TaxID=29523 RepID=UPI0026025377|nr:hypothetical protein [Bacteroides sp.]MDD3037903.1 hypothetical protein [Bacteroides sp.]
MAENASPCPTMGHFLEGEQCLENFPGTSPLIYFGVKSELSEPMILTDNVYSAPKFKPGKGLFKFECKDDSNSIEGSSLGKRAGYKLTVKAVLDAANKMTSKLGRPLNNLDLFAIIPDGDDFQIAYDKDRKLVFDADGIKAETGAGGTDARVTTITGTLSRVKYPMLYVDIDNIDTLLEGYVAPAST